MNSRCSFDVINYSALIFYLHHFTFYVKYGILNVANIIITRSLLRINTLSKTKEVKMTKFKKSVGYCPELEIHNFCETFPEKTAKNAVEVLEILGNRARYMRYAPNEIHEGGCYAGTVLLSTGDLGMKLACLLNKMVSNVPIHDTGRVVLVHDMDSPALIPYIRVSSNGNYMLQKDTGMGIHLLQDNKFVVWLRSNLLFTEMYIAEKEMTK